MDYPKVKVCLDTSEDNLIDELYTPCLKWAERFDRGVGYFTTGWLTYNIAGLSDFASRGGKMRLITSPILSTEDTDAIIGTESQDGSTFLRLEAALLENVETLKREMEADIINTFSWMLYDGIIDMRFAIPYAKLEEGDFHDKFGIFYKGNDALSFSGSINDSKHGFQNYESIKVFKTWAGTQEYVDADIVRFEKIWNRKDRNLKIFTIPQAVKNKIFELRTPDRPYSLPTGSSKWVHQDIAVKTFLEKEHGILAMATGTGKTITAMKIINKLFDSGKIRRVVITMYGNDLLEQWAIQIRENYKNKQINYHYASQKMIDSLVNKIKLQATTALKQEIVRKTNEKLRRVIVDDFVEIESIDRYIKLKGRDGASEGQTLSIAYCFLGTLFEDSELEFPFIIDSPTGKMDFEKRQAVADIIPLVFNQMIAFVQSAEVERFADRFYANPDSQYLTVVASPQDQSVVVHEGIEFFDSYQREHKGDDQ